MSPVLLISLSVLLIVLVTLAALALVRNGYVWQNFDEPNYHGSYNYGSLSCNFIYCYMSDVLEIKDLECSNNSLSTLEKIESAERLIENHIRADLLDLREN